MKGSPILRAACLLLSSASLKSGKASLPRTISGSFPAFCAGGWEPSLMPDTSSGDNLADPDTSAGTSGGFGGTGGVCPFTVEPAVSK
jgi:hypothetical protein